MRLTFSIKVKLFPKMKKQLPDNSKMRKFSQIQIQVFA
jgi:hypothetical protein